MSATEYLRARLAEVPGASRHPVRLDAELLAQQRDHDLRLVGATPGSPASRCQSSAASFRSAQTGSRHRRSGPSIDRASSCARAAIARGTGAALAAR